jgi:hypothetical protein
MEGLIPLKVKRKFQPVKTPVPETQMPVFAYVNRLGENINALKNNVEIITGSFRVKINKPTFLLNRILVLQISCSYYYTYLDNIDLY